MAMGKRFQAGNKWSKQAWEGEWKGKIETCLSFGVAGDALLKCLSQRERRPLPQVLGVGADNGPQLRPSPGVAFSLRGPPVCGDTPTPKDSPPGNEGAKALPTCYNCA